MAESAPKLYSEVSGWQPGSWRDIPEIVHDEHNIKGFFGEYRWLSNFGAANVQLDGVEYASVEKAYQAAKWCPEDRSYFTTCTNEESILYNRAHTPNGYVSEEWDARKLDVMRFLLEQKFDPSCNPESARNLLATDGRYIEETNWWGDTFWGKTLEGEGKNNLGQLLMSVRSELVAIPN